MGTVTSFALRQDLLGCLLATTKLPNGQLRSKPKRLQPTTAPAASSQHVSPQHDAASLDRKMKQDMKLTSPTSGFSAPEEEVTRLSSSFVSWKTLSKYLCEHATRNARKS
jgi:hypothetical protein